jgi:hypothetical protein
MAAVRNLYFCLMVEQGKVVSVLNYAPQHEDVWVAASRAPRILNLFSFDGDNQ